MPSIPVRPLALTIAGSDCSGGAGLQADLRAFAEIGVRSASVITCVVAENAERVLHVEPITPEAVAAQLHALAESAPVAALKTGMTWSPEIVEALAMTLWKIRRERRWPSPPLVVDPVGMASTGSALARPGWGEALASMLLPLATLVTPNAMEAELLLGGTLEPRHLADAAETLADRHGCAFLLKGGHLGEEDDLVRDALALPGETAELLESPRIPGATGLHGTGCVLSAAITARLALGQTLPDTYS